MKVATIPQPWASLVMTEAIEYILPLEESVVPGETILIYATEKDMRYSVDFERERVDDLWYNETILGNLEEELETSHFLGYVKALDIFPRKQNRIYVNDVHCFEKPIYSKNARPSADILKSPCKKKNYNNITFKTIHKGLHDIVIPLGREAWENLILKEEDINLYWNEEFRQLTSWIESFKDEKGFWDEQFNVIFKHEGREVVWTMLNDDLHKTYYPIYETDEKTGKKSYAGNVDVLHIGVTYMECLYPERELVVKERELLLNPKVKEKPKEHREWVHIIYTPMGNKRR